MYKYFYVILLVSPCAAFAVDIQIVNKTGFEGAFNYNYYSFDQGPLLSSNESGEIAITKWIGAGFHHLTNQDIRARCEDLDPANINQITFRINGEEMECDVTASSQPSPGRTIKVTNKTESALKIGYTYNYDPSGGKFNLRDQESQRITATETIAIKAEVEGKDVSVRCPDRSMSKNVEEVAFIEREGEIVCEFSDARQEREAAQKTKVIAATKERVKLVKNHIASLYAKGKQPKLVIGATSTDNIALDDSWILANNDIKDTDNPRNLYLDFLQEGSLAIIAEQFANTFHGISFDMDVLNYMDWLKSELGYKKFGLDDIKLIKSMLVNNGKFYMPRQLIFSEEEAVNINTLADFIGENSHLVDSNEFVFEKIVVGKSLDYREQYDSVNHKFYNLPAEEVRRRKMVQDDIRAYLLKHNVERILTAVFGEGRVQHKQNAILPIRNMEVPDLYISTK